MTVTKIMIEEEFFSAPPGATLTLIPNSRQMQVCDVCGNKKYCDWYEWDPERRGMTGMDVCPTCAKKLAWRESA